MFLYGLLLSLWCFSVLVDHYFQVSCHWGYSCTRQKKNPFWAPKIILPFKVIVDLYGSNIAKIEPLNDFDRKPFSAVNGPSEISTC